MEGSALQSLDEAECWRRLRSQRLGRLAILVEGRPEVFPVSFAARERSIFFRSAAGAKLAHAPRGPACFEVDAWQDRSGSGWSVMAHGRVEEVPDDGRMADLHPAAPGSRPHLLALRVERVSGRAFSHGALAPPLAFQGAGKQE